MSIAENLERVRAEVAGASLKSGRSPDAVTLIAVSKTWPVEVIEQAVAAGQKIFGENKVQELLAKVPAMADDMEWHLIGHLQKNKTRKVLPLCSSVHTVDSVELAQQMNRIAGELELKPSVLVQVNVSGDEAKFGFPAAGVREVWESLLELDQLKIEGLMTVPAFNSDPEAVRPDFARLRDIRDSLVEEFGRKLPELSMGMSHDFVVAIEEGATLVRVGSSIFGKRDYGAG
ncbi:MAG: YggS family pyridoxal phosphate-dependent enzyme [Verrucomicrobiales bacterium]|nr:YggS family pyridoxal phosphate-dependent enzyme [Verrucomicrobiales bacterium]